MGQGQKAGCTFCLDQGLYGLKFKQKPENLFWRNFWDVPKIGNFSEKFDSLTL